MPYEDNLNIFIAPRPARAIDQAWAEYRHFE